MLDNRLTVIGKHLGYDYETITVADTAIGLTAAKLNTTPRPISAFITCESAICRFRYDGTDPTDTVGHELLPTGSLVIEGIGNLRNIKFIRKGTTSATLQVTYRK